MSKCIHFFGLFLLMGLLLCACSDTEAMAGDGSTATPTPTPQPAHAYLGSTLKDFQAIYGDFDEGDLFDSTNKDSWTHSGGLFSDEPTVSLSLNAPTTGNALYIRVDNLTEKNYAHMCDTFLPPDAKLVKELHRGGARTYYSKWLAHRIPHISQSDLDFWYGSETPDKYKIPGMLLIAAVEPSSDTTDHGGYCNIQIGA